MPEFLKLFVELLAKYSWRLMVGALAASAILLFFATPLGISAWTASVRPWLLMALIVSCVILLTYLATFAIDHLRGKPRIDLRMVPGSPQSQRWNIGAIGDKPTLSVTLAMHFAHDVPDKSVHIKRAYLKGTQEVFPMIGEIVVDGPYGEQEVVHMALLPIKSKPGKPLKARVVFVDQFNEKHVSDKIVFSPQTLPSASRGNQAMNCHFCHQPVELRELAVEASMPAHRKCIWPHLNE